MMFQTWSLHCAQNRVSHATFLLPIVCDGPLDVCCLRARANQAEVW